MGTVRISLALEPEIAYTKNHHFQECPTGQKGQVQTGDVIP